MESMIDNFDESQTVKNQSLSQRHQKMMTRIMMMHGCERGGVCVKVVVQIRLSS